MAKRQRPFHMPPPAETLSSELECPFIWKRLLQTHHLATVSGGSSPAGQSILLRSHSLQAALEATLHNVWTKGKPGESSCQVSSWGGGCSLSSSGARGTETAGPTKGQIRIPPSSAYHTDQQSPPTVSGRAGSFLTAASAPHKCGVQKKTGSAEQVHAKKLTGTHFVDLHNTFPAWKC